MSSAAEHIHRVLELMPYEAMQSYREPGCMTLWFSPPFIDCDPAFTVVVSDAGLDETIRSMAGKFDQDEIVMISTSTLSFSNGAPSHRGICIVHFGRNVLTNTVVYDVDANEILELSQPRYTAPLHEVLVP
jgi:hypothetical protein